MSPEKEKSAPGWLKQLERQSWEPELIISIASIYACLILPDLILESIDYFYVNSSRDFLIAYSFTSTYLMAASYALLINFIGLLILRGFWIGLVGLQSVFPGGIKFNTLPNSDYFKEKLKAKLPDIRGFSKKLDDICSGLFAFSFLIVIVMICYSILVLVMLLIYKITLTMLPDYITKRAFVLVCLAIFFAIITIMSVLNLKFLRHKKSIAKIHFNLFWYVFSVSMLFFNKAFQYIYFTFYTNIEKWKITTYILIYMFTIIAITIPVLNKNNPYRFTTLSFYSSGKTDAEIYSDRYDNLRAPGKRIFKFSLNADIIEGKYLKLFIPYLKTEDEKIRKICKDLETPDDLSKTERRKMQDNYNLKCLRSYYSVYINDSLYDNLEYRFYIHPNVGEKGIITYIHTNLLREGKNILKVGTYKDKEGEDKSKYPLSIPFWVVKDG